jgi:hypothetical protein
MPTRHPPVHMEDEAEAGALSPTGVPAGQNLAHHHVSREQALQGTGEDSEKGEEREGSRHAGETRWNGGHAPKGP